MSGIPGHVEQALLSELGWRQRFNCGQQALPIERPPAHEAPPGKQIIVFLACSRGIVPVLHLEWRRCCHSHFAYTEQQICGEIPANGLDDFRSWRYLAD